MSHFITQEEFIKKWLTLVGLIPNIAVYSKRWEWNAMHNDEQKDIFHYMNFDLSITGSAGWQSYKMWTEALENTDEHIRDEVVGLAVYCFWKELNMMDGSTRITPEMAERWNRGETRAQLLEQRAILSFNSDFDEVDWLVDGLIPAGTVGMIYGESGSFKSWVACELARQSVESPGYLVGRSVKRQPVIYLCGEGANGVNMRLRGIGNSVWRNGKNLNGNQVALVLDSLTKKVTEPLTIIYDTLNSIGFGIDNNNSASVSSVFKRIQDMGTPGSTHIILHHANKAGDSMEGSHVFKSNADFVLRTELVDSDQNQFMLISEKVKDAGRVPPIRCELNSKLRVARAGSDHLNDIRLSLLEKFGEESVSPSVVREFLKENEGVSVRGAKTLYAELVASQFVTETGSTRDKMSRIMNGINTQNQ